MRKFIDYFLVCVIVAGFVYLVNHLPSPVHTWYWLMGIMSVFIMVVGRLITGHPLGVFIDDRNVVSLSRVQMTAWTVVILSAFMAAVFRNTWILEADPIGGVKLEPSLWMLMGISTTSLLASPLILSTKKSKAPNSQDLKRVLELLPSGSGQANQGLIFGNRTIDKANWKDLFTGEETSNAAHLDLSRIQMFFFTVVSILTYAFALRVMFLKATGAVGAFPVVPEGLLALIGISHGGYLTMKAIPNGREESGGGTAPAAEASAAPASDADDEHPAVG